MGFMGYHSHPLPKKLPPFPTKNSAAKMPFLGKLFDKKRKRKQATPTAEEAINNLRDIEAILVKKQEYYEEKIAAEVATAKKHGTKNQKLALAALKRKKHHETELSRIDGVLMKIEAQRTALEDAGLNMEVIGVLDHTTAALRLANQNLDIDKAGFGFHFMGGLLSDEFATAISQPIGDVHDEDELMKELEDLEK
ncbi:SNF7 family protein, partial [Ancylostoma ceylanicum]